MCGCLSITPVVYHCWTGTVCVAVYLSHLLYVTVEQEQYVWLFIYHTCCISLLNRNGLCGCLSITPVIYHCWTGTVCVAVYLSHLLYITVEQEQFVWLFIYHTCCISLLNRNSLCGCLSITPFVYYCWTVSTINLYNNREWQVVCIGVKGKTF